MSHAFERAVDRKPFTISSNSGRSMRSTWLLGKWVSREQELELNERARAVRTAFREFAALRSKLAVAVQFPYFSTWRVTPAILDEKQKETMHLLEEENLIHD